MNQTNKSALAELIGYPSGCTDGANSLNITPNCIYKNFNTPAEKVNSTDYSAAMFEVFKYFGGYTSPADARNDIAGAPLDASHFGPFRYAGDPDAKSDRYAYTPTTDTTRTTYDPPLPSTASCAKSYVIFIGNGFPPGDAPATLLSGVGGDTTYLPLNNMVETSTTSTTTSPVFTTACGIYADTASCATAAATTYGTQYDTYSCILANTCASGSITTTSFGTSACNAYTDATACLTALPGLHPGYTSYSCSVSATACTVAQATTTANNTVVADTGCIADNLANSTSCTNYGNTHYPSYSGFSCTSLGNTGCSGGSKHWKLTATSIDVAGQKFDMSGTLNNTSTTYSHTIYGTATRTIIAATPTGTFSLPTTKARYADEWARFLNRTDVSAAPGQQNISTFTIDVFKDQPDANQTALLMSMARAGGGKYYAATNEQDIRNALRKIISEIQAVNSVFASSSLPVSVNTQGTYLNQVFMGMFRPDSSAAPRWAGNLKQYKFKVFNGVLRLSDMNGNEAISTTTGFVTPCATSFWTSDTGSYWDFPGAQALGDCTAALSAFPTAGSTSIFSDAPDGEVVEKGGAAQHLRGVMSAGGVLTASSQKYSVCTGIQTPETADCRKVLTCDGSSATSCTSTTSFDTGNTAITATNLNLPVASERDNLINWVRGQDVDNENGNMTTVPAPIVNEVRPSVHGGVVHAQPAVIDFGGTTGVVAFYGADDAVFHAVKGGNTAVTDGTELWSFIAPEHYGQLNRVRDNGNITPRIDFAGTLGSVAPKQYGFDGGIGVYQAGTVASPIVWIYPGMRRGGRGLYAFDVSTPANPLIKWRKGCFTVDDSVCSTGWSSIGQTWSEPIMTHLAGSTRPVLVFGGGYDTCEDTDSQIRCGTTPRKGANIWFVDADTGVILRTYATNYSVPGDVTLLLDANGFLTHVYATDTGGYVYRVNVGTWDGSTSLPVFTGSWSVDNTTQNVNAPTSISIANLSDGTNQRKFLNGPAVVVYSGFNAVLVGSGDREHPLLTDYSCLSGTASGVKNQFYMVIDRPNSYLAPATTADLVDVSVAGATFNATTASITDNTGLLDTAPTRHTSDRGWRFDFSTCEQTVNKPLVITGVTYFGTNAPGASSSACVANLGAARGYAVDFLTGNPVRLDTETGNMVVYTAGTSGNRSAPYTGGGMPPSPVAGVVDVDGTRMPFCIGCINPEAASSSALEGIEVIINPQGSRFRTYWYIEND